MVQRRISAEEPDPHDQENKRINVWHEFHETELQGKFKALDQHEKRAINKQN